MVLVFGSFGGGVPSFPESSLRSDWMDILLLQGRGCTPFHQ